MSRVYQDASKSTTPAVPLPTNITGRNSSGTMNAYCGTDNAMVSRRLRMRWCKQLLGRYLDARQLDDLAAHRMWVIRFRLVVPMRVRV
jgi:hypothetical protein